MLVKKNKRINILNEKGQAIFELVIFMPFLIYMFTVIVTVGNSINASINQQKVTRGYSFYLIKGNSTIPTMDDLIGTFQAGAIEKGSAVVVGWKEDDMNGEVPKAPCFKFSSFLGNTPTDTCEEPQIVDKKSAFIRVYTVFGLCGATYGSDGSGFYKPLYRNIGLNSCTLQ